MLLSHQGPKDEDDFCKARSDKEPLYGFTGTMKCLREGHGDVGFFHTYDVMKNYHDLSEEFDILCKNKRHDLNWENVVNPNCHMAVEYPQVCLIIAPLSTILEFSRTTLGKVGFVEQPLTRAASRSN